MLKIIIKKLPSLSLFVGVWLWCFSLNAFAQSASCNRPTVYYVNGVNTTLTAAHEGAKELSVAIAEKFPQHGVTVRAIHNPSESLLSDLPEVAVTQHWLQVGIDLILAVASITNPGLSAWLQKELDDVAAIFRRIDAIENIKKTVLAQIKASSAPVILIAHSQGNIMVNEAVRQLKSNSGTANIPGVKTIAVLGIGVADKQNMPLLLANGENIDLYRYITSDRDLVLKPLQGILPPNFVVSANRSFDISNHLLIGSYLNIENRGFRGSLQNLQPGNVDSRSVVVGLFDELYRNAAQAWPCFTLSSTPNPSVVGQEVVFSVTAKGRLSGNELPGQAVSLTFGDVTSPTLICSATLDSAGNASCRQTFLAPVRTEKVWVNYKPVALPGFLSDHYFHGMSASLSHWAGSFKTTDCTSPPADAEGTWMSEHPCFVHGPIAGSERGYFYFDDSSPNIVFGDIVGKIQNIRRVLPLGWKSTDSSFTLTVPTTFQQMVTDPTDGTRVIIISRSGTRTTSFIVLNRSPTSLSGTFVISTQSGYKARNSAFYDWRVVQTKASGAWSASLSNTPLPQTTMNGFDFCFIDGSAAYQMTSFTQGNPVQSPAWATPYTTNGCRF